MSYPFNSHWFIFTDKGEIYQNYFEYTTGLTTPWEQGTKVNIETLVDKIIDAYETVNEKLGIDFVSTNPASVKAYADEITARTNSARSDVTIVLSLVEAGLNNSVISSPELKLQGKIPSTWDKVETAISKTASGVGTILENVGEGIVNTSSAFKNLPTLLGVGALGVLAYYFLMVTPKEKG